MDNLTPCVLHRYFAASSAGSTRLKALMFVFVACAVIRFSPAFVQSVALWCSDRLAVLPLVSGG